MRTNIEIDDGLLREARKLTGLKTKKELVARGLQMLVDVSRQEQIRKLRGKLKWEGDSTALRRNR